MSKPLGRCSRSLSKSIGFCREARCDGEAIAWLCYMMNSDIYCPSNLPGILWEFLFDANNLLSDGLKEMIQELISQCFTLPTDFSEVGGSGFASLLPELEVVGPEKEPPFVSPHKIWPRKFSHIISTWHLLIFCYPPSSFRSKEWAHQETQRMFSPPTRLGFRRHNLLRLVLVNMHSPTYAQTIAPHSPDYQCAPTLRSSFQAHRNPCPYRASCQFPRLFNRLMHHCPRVVNVLGRHRK